MDHSANAASLFHSLADRYREKYMDLTIYHDLYREFCQLLPSGRARVLDAACGPGNVSRYLVSQRPDLDLLGIDLAPRMIELARQAVPTARFEVLDCRNIANLDRRFDGIICAFGLPYLLCKEAEAFIKAAANALDANGVFYLSAMLGRSEDSGLEPCSTGDRVYITYYTEEQLLRWIAECGFTIVNQKQISSPSAAPKSTTDFIVIAQK